MRPSHHIEKVSIFEALTRSNDRVRRSIPQIGVSVAKVVSEFVSNQKVSQRITLHHGSWLPDIGNSTPRKSDIRKARHIKLVAGRVVAGRPRRAQSIREKLPGQVLAAVVVARVWHAEQRSDVNRLKE